MEDTYTQDSVTMDKLVSLCKRRGFVFQSSEIYGGLSSAWDYGPLGIELKRKLHNLWWREMTQLNKNIVGVDAAIIMHPRVWQASGHVEHFTDPLVDCKSCRQRFRADQIEADPRVEDDQSVVGDQEGRPKRCPNCGGELTDPRNFNLLFKTNIGPVEDDGSIIYLRPETAQGSYVNFKNVLQTARLKIPFGIAQVGKAFRNEITTKNFIFRTCEFEQMEMQFFVQPSEDDRWFEHWKRERYRYYLDLGIRERKLRFHQHGPDELAHYAKIAFDIQYEFPFGWKELEGIHNRTDFDLRRHMEYSGKDLAFLDDATRERFVPYVIETAAGLTRTVLVVLSDAYDEEDVDGETRVVLRLHPLIAPVTVGVFPLVKKDGLAELAGDVERELRQEFSTFYDQGGAIGRRYRRQDEIGTPFCVTVDYETKENRTVTLRYRDSMQQERVAIDDLAATIRDATKRYRREH